MLQHDYRPLAVFNGGPLWMKIMACEPIPPEMQTSQQMSAMLNLD